jgi:hypothetical protein
MNWTPITQSWTAQDYDDALTFMQKNCAGGDASEADCAFRYVALLQAKSSAGFVPTPADYLTLTKAYMRRIEKRKLLACSPSEIATLVKSGVTTSLADVLKAALAQKRTAIEAEFESNVPSMALASFHDLLTQKIKKKLALYLTGPQAGASLTAFHAALGLLPPVSQPVAVPPATTQKWLDIGSLNVRVPTHAGVPSVLRGQKVYKVSRQVYAASQAYAKAAETQAHEQGVVYLKRASEHNFYVTAFETCQEVGQLFKSQALTFYYHGGSVVAEDLPANA